MNAREKSFANPTDAEDIRKELMSAVLQRWCMPMVDGTMDGTKFDILCSLPTKKFRVTIEEV